MTRPKTGTVYALIDPRDGAIRYVGKTEQPVLARLAGHLAQPTNPAMRVWINSLGMQGMIPRIETVSTVDVTRLATEEQRQIRRHAQKGHRLLNAPYYRHHLDDLHRQPCTAENAPDEPQPKRAPQASGGLDCEFYRPLAAARAEGRVAAWVVALVVILSAPIYLALLILGELLGVRVVRILLGVTLMAWPAWESGFDRAVHDLVLSRLPLNEWSALWATYGAGPLSNLASSFLWPGVITSVIMAGAAYGNAAQRLPH